MNIFFLGLNFSLALFSLGNDYFGHGRIIFSSSFKALGLQGICDQEELHGAQSRGNFKYLASELLGRTQSTSLRSQDLNFVMNCPTLCLDLQSPFCLSASVKNFTQCCLYFTDTDRIQPVKYGLHAFSVKDAETIKQDSEKKRERENGV